MHKILKMNKKSRIAQLRFIGKEPEIPQHIEAVHTEWLDIADLQALLVELWLKEERIKNPSTFDTLFPIVF